MVKILGDPFDEYIHDQINVRQKSLAKKQKSDDDIKVFNTSTPWIRLSSSIEVSKDRAEKLAINLGVSTADIVGSALAKKLVLFAGTTDGKGGTQRGGVGYGFNNAYGFLSDPGQGYKPMPGIISISTTYKSNGSLKQAQVKLKCYTRKQFEALEAIYLRLGYTMILEYGHSVYFNNAGIKQNMSSLDIPNILFHQAAIIPEEWAKAAAAAVKGDQKVKDAVRLAAYSQAEEVAKDPYGADSLRLILQNNKRFTGGNYDALLAKVSNFSWSLGNDLSYDITLDLVSVGDIIDSLKMNLGGSTETGLTLTATTSKGVQNLVNIRLQRNTGLFITFLQELTELLGTPEALALVNKEAQKAMKEINESVNLAQAQADYADIYLTELKAIEDKIITPYNVIRNTLRGKEAKREGNKSYGLYRETINLKDFASLEKTLADNMSIEGTSNLLPYLQGDINKLIPVFTSGLGIYTGKEQSVLDYYGLDYESYTATIKFDNKDHEVTRHRIVDKETTSSNAHENISVNIGIARGIIKTTAVTVPRRGGRGKVRTTIETQEDGERNAALIITLDKNKNNPKQVLNFFLLGGLSKTPLPNLIGYLGKFSRGDNELEELSSWILNNKVSF